MIGMISVFTYVLPLEAGGDEINEEARMRDAYYKPSSFAIDVQTREQLVHWMSFLQS